MTVLPETAVSQTVETETETRKLIATDAQLQQAREVAQRLDAGDLEQWVATGARGEVTLSGELSALVTTVVQTLARGATVTIGAMPEDVTTTTAAEMLGISRPTLMKMLAHDEIASHKVGTHTRLKSVDVVAFRRARLVRQRVAFEELLELEDGD